MALSDRERAASHDRADVVRARARALLFDYLVVTRRGAASPPGRAARALVEAPGAAMLDGADADATAPPTTAAFVNGIAAHAIELDDTYEPASLHPGVAVWPAVLALADERGATLGEALDAGIAGYDAMCGLGDRLDPGEAYARGFHPTGICGPIGAAVAACRLLDLNDAQAVHAVGIAASAASGLLAFLDDGAWTKPFHAGHAAAGGLAAARLAAAGYTGPASAIDGRLGFLHAFGGRGGEAPEPVASGHGVLGTAIKQYACCRYIHGNVDLLLELVRDEQLKPGEVASVSCGVLAAGWSLVADPIASKRRVTRPVDAQFSMPFWAALALSRQRVGLDDIERAAELAAELGPLIECVSCHRSDALEAGYPAAWGAEVVVHTSGGSELRREQAQIKGSPAQPLSHDELRAKGATLVGSKLADDLFHACTELAETAPVADLRTRCA